VVSELAVLTALTKPLRLLTLTTVGLAASAAAVNIKAPLAAAIAAAEAAILALDLFRIIDTPG
jgi:hypothetical protein